MKLLKTFTALITIFSIVSCNEKMLTEQPEGAGCITVSSQVGSQVKAGYDAATLPAEFVMDINQGDENFNYSLLTMTKADDSNTYKADIREIRWASNDHSNVQVKALTVPAGTALDKNNELAIIISSDQTTDEKFISNDILGASTDNGITIQGDHIDVCFNHLMAKIQVIYEAGENVSVTSIKLKNVSTGGVFSYETMSHISAAAPNNEQIDMYMNAGAQYGINTAEAIFHPYTSTSSNRPSLVVTANVNGTPKTFEPLYFASNGITFNGGKRYKLKIKVSADGVATSSLSTENAWTKNVPGGKILWVGTSIPAGSQTNNYPQMISNATGLEVVNNSIAATQVLRIPEPFPGGYDAMDWLIQNWDYKKGGGLSQTKQEAEQIYRERLMTRYKDEDGKGEQWVNEQISAVQSLSYESLIIPYIDGTLDNCQTIVIDHGFNDLWGVNGVFGMLWEAGYYISTSYDFEIGIYGATNLLALNKENYNSSYVPTITNTQGLSEEGSYLMCMERIINAINKANPNAKIIIGNYFALDSPWVRQAMSGTGLYRSDFNLTATLLYYNQAVANIWDLDIVNVYNTIGDIGDWSTFCIDGVHPSSDETGNSNRRIADVYLSEFSRIFGGTNTKTISNTTIPGWEDVEIL